MSYPTKIGGVWNHNEMLVPHDPQMRIFIFHRLLEWFSMGGGGIGSGTKAGVLFSSSISKTLNCSKLTGNERFRKS